ncbi:plastocyanin/azurin family copper-binding protein [Haloarchaeobius sp. DYHT-AS-18]|uniref:plastocyanin/azurin family copper-binding protein n=1 Tax=Haloarchaeobius sp. DYHT-AS-18 TaxID=3446117 RepID=UPI003EBD2CAF
MTRPTRRDLLTTATSSVFTLGLAGCLGGEETPGGDEMTTTTATAEPTTQPPDTTQPSTTTTTGSTGSGATEVVAVGPAGEFVFTPERLTVSPGTTVRFEWGSPGHTVSPTSQPDSADWAGVDDTKDAGYVHEHTFEVAGTYEYLCKPHQSLGMTGAIVVD